MDRHNAIGLICTTLEQSAYRCTGVGSASSLSDVADVKRKIDRGDEELPVMVLGMLGRFWLGSSRAHKPSMIQRARLSLQLTLAALIPGR